MAFSFNLPKPADVAQMLGDIDRELTKRGGTRKGDETAGCISISGAEGTYEVTADAVKLTVTKKPSVMGLRKISDSRVEKEIRKMFRKHVG
jgi:hypothetical protein